MNDRNERAGRQGIQVITRAGAVLTALEHAGDGLTLSELALATGMARSTVHRIAAALETEGLVVSSPRGLLRLGPRLVALARATRWHLGDAARPYLAELARHVDETVELGVLQGASLLLVDQVVARRRLRAVSSVGARFPSHCMAGGKVLLARLTDEAVTGLLPARLERLTAATITSPGELLEQLAAVRELGVAFDHDEESEGISGVAVPVSDGSGDSAAVTISGPSGRLRDREEEIAAALLAAAGELNATLRATAE